MTPVERVFRAEFPRLVAALTRVVRDVGRAEELAQDALVVALEKWPTSGVPENPGAWLMTHAKHRAIDALRHGQMGERKHEELAWTDDRQRDPAAALDEALDDPVRDDVLRLVFIACHPVLSTEARVALTLRLVGGLTTDEIARAFLTAEPTIAQRIVRAKKTLADAQVPFELPPAAELGERIASVLQVIYLVFNEGYAATAGDHWMRPALCDDARRLASIVAERAPDVAEAHGLRALLELQASRTAARTAPNGDPILLPDQDRSRWDADAITRGLDALARAEALGGAEGPYALQAALAACHARAATPESTDWHRIATIYGVLARVAPSPVVELNRAVAVGMAEGPAAGLAVVDAIRDPRLQGYPFLPSVRADLLARLGRHAEARAEWERAASLTSNARERELLLARAAALPD